MCGGNDDTTSRCAACGKKGEDLRTCGACKNVKYCNAECQKRHRREHRRMCKKEASRLFEEKLFADPPPKDDCPICFLPMPCEWNNMAYQSCCGKFICGGCYYSGYTTADKTEFLCPFCRAPPCDVSKKAKGGPKDLIVRLKKRTSIGDAEAFAALGDIYSCGSYGIPQNKEEAFQLWSKAADRGSVKGRHNLGIAYQKGNGVDIDTKKARYHFELAAIAGCEMSRFLLATIELHSDNLPSENITRATRHLMIAATRGQDESLKYLTKLYRGGYLAKNILEQALRAHKKATDDMKSEQRNKFPEWRKAVPGALPISR